MLPACKRGMHHAGDLRRNRHRDRAIRPGAGEPPYSSRLARRGRREKPVRRDLRQHRLHPDQDAGRQRPGGLCHPPRGRFRRHDREPRSGRHEAGQGAQGRRRAPLERGCRGLAARHAELHRLLPVTLGSKGRGGCASATSSSRPTRSSSMSAGAPRGADPERRRGVPGQSRGRPDAGRRQRQRVRWQRRRR